MDCKNCGMEFDEKNYGICPYCGEGPVKEAVESAELEEDETVKVREKTKRDRIEQEETGKNEKPKKAGSVLKYFFIGLAVLVVAAVAIFAFFPPGASSVTVPDKYQTIQEAIDAAEDGDEIVVQIGVYRENIDFKGKNIVLRSTDPNDPNVVDRTIIDGGDSGIVVSFRSGEGEDAALKGFTITKGSGIVVSGGSSPFIEGNVIEDNKAEFGAGIAIFDSSPTIINNTIINNNGFLGGGLFVESSSPLIEDNTIVANRAEMGSGIVIISNSSPMVNNNIIADNTAARLGGGVVVAVGSTPTLIGNTITGNRADRNGGGMLIEESEPIVENNNISQNTAANGGGIFIVNATGTALLISNNTIAENFAFIAGGGLYMEGSTPAIRENQFIDNISEKLGAGAVIYNSSPLFRSNSFEGNEAEELEGGGAIWVSEDSTLELNDPDDNIYRQNIPDDIRFE